jgi:predicted RNA binding protein YcfA (HicA-like mRNA interferase family)
LTKKATFGDIHYLLEKFGFVQMPVEGKHVLFKHKSGVLLMFRPHRLNERVDPMTLSIVRKTLDLNGFLEQDEFESALHEISANHFPKARQE